MVLVLSSPKDAQWHDLPNGVRLLVAPLDYATRQAAVAAAQAQLLAAVMPDDADAESLQSAVAAADDPIEEARLTGLSQQAVLQAFGKLLIKDWEGVVDEQNNKAPVTPESVEALLQSPTYAVPFKELIERPLQAVAEEGNG